MPGTQLKSSNKPYLRVIGGKLAQTVEQGTPDSKLRSYELKDGTKGQKWELVYLNWTGVIQSITFKDTDYGEMCVIEMEDAIITLATASRYFSSFAEKIMSADLSKEITVHPYDIVDGESRATGVALKQGEVRLTSKFWDDKVRSADFPQVDEAKKEKLKKNYWKVYFAEVESFLIEQIKGLKFQKKEAKHVVDEEFDDLGEVLENLPF